MSIPTSPRPRRRRWSNRWRRAVARVLGAVARSARRSGGGSGVRLRSGGVWRLRSGRDVCLRAVGLTLIVTLLLGLPASALAQSVSGPGNPLSPGLPQNQTPTQPTTTPAPVPQAPTTSTASGTGLSGSGTLVIAIGALVILG